MSDTDNAAEAALMARMSGGLVWSTASIVTTQ
jgi:hypothetical protein